MPPQTKMKKRERPKGLRFTTTTCHKIKELNTSALSQPKRTRRSCRLKKTKKRGLTGSQNNKRKN